jgi:predicted glycosyltransferase involved in capsule biosynthesis
MDATGGVRLSGCASFKFVFNYPHDHLVGSRVYVKKKAQKGILEVVVIKKANRVQRDRISYTGVDHIINYVDTMNRVWLEEELILKTAALDYAANYWRNYIRDAEPLQICNRE